MLRRRASAVRSTMRCEQQCWQESFFLPENARHVKGGNSDNVYVAMLDKDTSVVIYFGGTTVSGRLQRIWDGPGRSPKMASRPG